MSEQVHLFPSQAPVQSCPSTVHQYQSSLERMEVQFFETLSTLSSSPSLVNALICILLVVLIVLVSRHIAKFTSPSAQEAIPRPIEPKSSLEPAEGIPTHHIDAINDSEAPRIRDDNGVVPLDPDSNSILCSVGDITQIMLESQTGFKDTESPTLGTHSWSTATTMVDERSMNNLGEVNSDNRNSESAVVMLSSTARGENEPAILANPPAQDIVVNPEPTLAASAVEERGKIIYKLVCKDQANQQMETIRYSWKPFEGLARDFEEDDRRQKLAVMDVASVIYGIPSAAGRKNQHRHNFGTIEDKDPDPFVVGVDFYSRTVASTTIRILSPQLLNVIKSLIPYYPQFDFQNKEPLITEPFIFIFHYWDKLNHVSEMFGKEQEPIVMEHPETGFKTTIIYEDDTKSHLDILITSPPIQKEYTATVAPERALHIGGLATFNNLWLLFRPGDIVFGRIHGKLGGYVIERITYSPQIKGSPSPQFYPYPGDLWELSLWNLEYRNRKIIRESHNFQIDRYHGEKRISELPVFPISFMGDNDALKKQLIARGERYYHIICDEKRHMRYDGLTISDKRSYLVRTSTQLRQGYSC